MGTRRKRKQPLGKPLPESTDDNAVITQADIERAKQAWKKFAPPQYTELLDAEIQQGEEFE